MKKNLFSNSLIQKNKQVVFLLAALFGTSVTLNSLPLKHTKGFDRLLKIGGDIQVDFLNPLIGGVIFQKNQDLIENLVDYGQTKKTVADIDEKKSSHEMINVPSHPLALLAQRMFHRPTKNVRFIPTKVDPFFKSTVKSIEKQSYTLGWLCALVCGGKDIALQAKCYQKLSKKIYDTPDNKTLTWLKNEREKQAPDIIRFTEGCRDLLEITDIFLPVEIVRLVIKACTMGTRKIGLDRNKSEIVRVYQKQLPLLLITSYIYAQAQSKHDLIEFVRGFFDHYKDKASVFTADGIRILSSKKEQDYFEKLFYTKEDVKKITEVVTQPPHGLDPAPVLINIFNNDYCYGLDQKPTVSDILYIGALAGEKTDNCNIETRDGFTCDCAECGILFLAKTILYNEEKEAYDLNLLPEAIQSNHAVKKFPEKFQNSINNLDARTWWFYLFSDQEGKHNKADFIYGNKKHFYELEPEAENVRKALSLFFGISTDTFEELGQQLSSSRQSVNFVANKHNHKQVEITMTITSLDNQIKKEASIIVNWHQHIEIKEALSLDKWMFLKLIRDVLEKQTSDFPFNIILADDDSAHRHSFFHSFSLRSGFEMLCRMGMNGITSKKTQRELFNLESITLNQHSFEGCFPFEVTIHLLTHLDERPFKNLLESLKPSKILGLFDDKDAFYLIKTLDEEWIKTNAATLAPSLFGPKNTNYDFISAFAHNPKTAPYCYFTENVEPEIILLGLCVGGKSEDTIDPFLSIMGAHWFTDQSDAVWQRIKDTPDALRYICFHINKPLIQALVEKVGVTRFLHQLIELSSDDVYGNLFQCLMMNANTYERIWLQTNIKAIWDAAKTKRTHLKCFIGLLTDASLEFLQACFARISFTEFFTTLQKTGLLEETIISIMPTNNSRPRPLYTFLIAAQEKRVVNPPLTRMERLLCLKRTSLKY